LNKNSFDALISEDEEDENDGCFEDGITQSPATRGKSSTPQVIKMPSADAVFEGRWPLLYETTCLVLNVLYTALLSLLLFSVSQ